MVEPVFKHIAEKKLVGQCLTMSLANDQTGLIWKNFMPRRKEIKNSTTTALISLQVYDLDYFELFDPGREFQKWAALEVTGNEPTPEGLQSFTIPPGLYAVFHYIGSSTDSRIFHYIYNDWLPNSAYVLDHRPHFELLGEKYRNNDPESEEEIWIPVKPKG